MFNLRYYPLVALVAVFSFETTPDAIADVVIQFSPDNSISNISVQQGQSFEVDVYIAQTNAFTGLSNSGLIGFGFRGLFQSTMLQAIGGTTDTEFNFSGTPNADILTAGQVDMFGGASNPPKGSVIHLGTLNFTALSAGLTTISLGDLDPTFDDFTLDDAPLFTSLDSNLFDAGFDKVYGLNVTITAVPEPSTLVLSLATVLSVCLGRFRRQNISPKI